MASNPNIVQAVVLYPLTADSKFDMDYYLKTHMPLVDQHWGPAGLQGWAITEYVEADGQKPKYSVQATLTWESASHLDKALKGEGAKAIFGDVPKFSNVEPVLMMGNVVSARGVMLK